MMLPLASLVASLSLFHARASAQDDGPQAPAPAALEAGLPSDARTLLGPSYRTVSGALTPALKEALAARDWPGVIAAAKAVRKVDLREAERNELAFLEAWAYVHDGRAEAAVPLLEQVRGALTAPRPYVDLVLGEILLADGEPVDALAALSAVPAESAVHARASVLRAETLKQLDRRTEAAAVFAEVVGRPDPAAGNALALLALGQQLGPGSPEAYVPLRRVWANYPTSGEASRAATLLASYPPRPEYKPTADEWSRRAEGWMNAGDWDKALDAASNVAVAKDDRSEAACRALFVRGRSQYKKNALGAAVAAFEDAGDRCVGVPGDYGPRALYLQGTAQFRRKQFAEAAATFAKIPAKYPEHSMADDGYLHGGIALQDGGDLAGAQALWKRALEELPQGDVAPEATWRLAWSLYLEGRTDDARAIAARLGELPVNLDPVHVDAGRYWAARWALYPDVNDPRKPNEAGRATAVTGWQRLLAERPFSFYAILAAGRLGEVAPDVLAKMQVRPEAAPLVRPWEVSVGFLEHPGVQAGAALARLGLMSEARAEWSRYDEDLLGDEKAWTIELRAMSGDWLYAHEDFRGWLGSHAVGSHGPGERAIIRVAYPDRYWEEVKVAAKPYTTRYDPRLFHALVREESNFNRKIVSFAGARGLSQLMPATATQTAGWLGKKVTMDELFEPATNLEIGAKYLDTVLKQFDGSPYCALAGYNAGPARVNQWSAEWGNPPTDEFVERIPFRETRGYVKRVMGTWQTYRWFIDEGEPFANLSAYNHKTLTKR